MRPFHCSPRCPLWLTATLPASLAPAGEIVSTFDHPEMVRLGECDLIEEIMIGEDKVIRFSGVKAGEACTCVVAQSIPIPCLAP